MKKLGIFVVAALIVLVVWYSGWLSQESTRELIERAFRGLINLVGEGIIRLIDWVKSLT